MEDVAYEVNNTSIPRGDSILHLVPLSLSFAHQYQVQSFAPNADGYFCLASSLVAGVMLFNPGASEKK